MKSWTAFHGVFVQQRMINNESMLELINKKKLKINKIMMTYDDSDFWLHSRKKQFFH